MATCSFLKATDVKSLARNDMLLWTEICAIQQAILTAAADGELETIVNDGTPMTWISGIASTTVDDGGTGYFPVVASATISHPTGTGAAVTPIVSGTQISEFTVDNAGSLTLEGVTVVSGGTGYTVGDVLTLSGGTFTTAATVTVTAETGGVIDGVDITNHGAYTSQQQPTGNISLTGGTGNGATISGVFLGYQPLTATIDMTGLGDGNALIQPIVNEDTGEITNVVILNSGTGYIEGVAVPAVYPKDSTGTPFAATVSLVNGSGGILAINITNNGTGYETVYPTVSVSHPTGTGFEGVVATDGGVLDQKGVLVQNGGYNYQPLLPTASVIDSTGIGAQLEITESDIVGGAIQNIQIVESGFGYSQNATVEITAATTSSGSGAEATVTVMDDPNSYGVTSPFYYDVLNGQRSDRVRAGQIEYVQDYFTALGYNIRAQVNPNTGSTMQWWILW